MPDISLCRNEECKKKRECYRYMAIPRAFWQSYMNPPHEECRYFYKIAKGVKTKAPRPEKYTEEMIGIKLKEDG